MTPPIHLTPNILDLDYTPPRRFRTGVEAFDGCFTDRIDSNVGLAAGMTALLTGKPGLGKTTLAIQLLDGLTRGGCFTMFATNEQTQDSVVGLAKGIKLQNGVNAIVEDAYETEFLITRAYEAIAEHKPEQFVLAIDSLQGLNLDQRNSTKRAWEDLEAFAKSTEAIIIIINHLRKDNVMAGAAVIKQRCDAVLELARAGASGGLELKIDKNRYGLSGIAIDGMLMGRDGINFNSAVAR
jgi:DNA repair protein RadA/Sms